MYVHMMLWLGNGWRDFTEQEWEWKGGAERRTFGMRGESTQTLVSYGIISCTLHENMFDCFWCVVTCCTHGCDGAAALV